MNENLARKLIKIAFPQHKVFAIMESSNGYIFGIEPEANQGADSLVDPFVKITSDGTITDFSPIQNQLEYKNALNHVIYNSR